jgi:hypothetical protein
MQRVIGRKGDNSEGPDGHIHVHGVESADEAAQRKISVFRILSERLQTFLKSSAEAIR